MKGINYMGTENELGGCQNDAVSVNLHIYMSLRTLIGEG